ncbi:MAG TPA: GNAT family N-acetyltransferase [Actinomycetota bacterium]|nr:GNAT family N-acetyltransferase [Actinomycetota bacterium]
MALDVRVDCTERCFELPEWKELLERDPNRHIFATPEWNRLWWEQFGAGKDLFVLTMYSGEDLTAIVPLYRKPEDGRKIFRFNGGIDLTDYQGPVCSLDDRDVVAETLVKWLAETDIEWDEFDAHNMPVPLGFAEFLVERADRDGFSWALDQEETTAVMTLPDSWDEYLEHLDKKERHELRRKRRRLGRDHPDARIHSSDEDTLEEDLSKFIDLHRQAEGTKGRFMGPEIAEFFKRIADCFASLGWLRLDTLSIGDRALASTFSFQYDNTFYLYNSAFDPTIGRLSPGYILVSQLIEDAIEGGVRRFDFLRGPERYKYQFGARPLPLNNVRVLRHP